MPESSPDTLLAAAPRTSPSESVAPDAGSPTNSPFEEPWWLDAVAPGAWGAVTVTRGDEVVARLPYVLRQRGHLTTVVQPPLTQSLGPWIAPGEGCEARRHGLELELLGELIDSLPSAQAHFQQLSPSLEQAMPFIWRGYSATPRYTYRIEDLSDLERLWTGFSRSVRRQVRRAERQFEVRTDLGLDVLLDLHRETITHLGPGAEIDEAALRRADAVLSERGLRQVIVAVDTQGRPQAADYVLWDSRCLYSLLACQRRDARGSGAASLLVWRTIQHASTVARAFDLQGSMIPSIATFNRGFGAQPRQYLSVTKINRWLRPLVALRGSLKRGVTRLHVIVMTGGASSQWPELLVVAHI